MNRFTAKLFVAVALCLSICANAAQSSLSWGVHVDGTTLQNNIFAANSAISTMQSGTTDPGPNGGAYSFWMDTGNSLWKQRNSTNSGWITLGPLLSSYAHLSGGRVPASLLPVGGTSSPGILQLTNATNSTSTSTAATPNSVKSAFDWATSAHNYADAAYNLAASKGTAASASVATNGYTYDPNTGIRIQWGRTPATVGASGTLPYPVIFNNVFAVIANFNGYGGSSGYVWKYFSVDNVGFTWAWDCFACAIGVGNGGEVHWVAIGN